MARKDYRYTGFEDEKAITELMLYALPKVCRAKADRERWIESCALNSSSPLDSVAVQGGLSRPKEERYMEAKDNDKILKWLTTIEVRLGDKIRHLPKVERDVVCEYYLSGDMPSHQMVARKLQMRDQTVRAVRLRAVDKLVRACTSVYHTFCLWREVDDMELEARRGLIASLIGKNEAA